MSGTVIIRRAYFSLLVIYWQLYGSFTVVSRLPCFCGPIDACANSGYQALLRVREGLGTRLTQLQNASVHYLEQLTIMSPSNTGSTGYNAKCRYISNVLLIDLLENVLPLATCLRGPHTGSPVSGGGQDMFSGRGDTNAEWLNRPHICSMPQDLTRELIFSKLFRRHHISGYSRVHVMTIFTWNMTGVAGCTCRPPSECAR